MRLRDYQKDLAVKGSGILKSQGLVYYAIEVRVGKTLISMETCRQAGMKKVLFATRKKAISSIESDYEKFGYSNSFDIVVINHESIHKVNDNDFDCVVIDEAHRLGAFPKPSLLAKRIKEKFSHLPMVYLSGTPHPECLLQIYHQLWVNDKSPLGNESFYKWHTLTGLIRYKFDLGYGLITNYNSNTDTMYKYYGIEKRKIKKEDTKALQYIKECMFNDAEKIRNAEDRINKLFEKIKVSYTQKQAGFSTEIKENILYVDMLPSTYRVANMLIRDKIVQGKDRVIIADTAVKVQNKLHQIYSGTVIFEDGESGIIDKSKAKFVRNYFANKKIGIFYKFQAEYDLLKLVYGDDVTNDLDEFNNTNKSIALQVVSGREGVSLKNADFLVFFNIDFSAVSYWQARDRMSTMQRLNNNVYWVFSRGGIEDRIYKSVVNKKNYTLNVFKKDYYGK